MKHYIEQNNHWKTGKALTFLANFIRHHDKSVDDDDTFAAIAELLTQEELVRLVKETFPEKILSRMQNAPRCNRLDFDDEPSEIIREIWSATYARTRLRKMLQNLIDQYLKQHPLCTACQAEGKIVPATVVDHIIPHRGDRRLFWDQTNWEPLCKECHDKKTGSGL